MAQGSYGSGMGRYIGGLIPDVIVRADGTISPVRSASWVGGVEQVVSKDFSIAAYYSGAYAYRNHGVDSDGMYLGFGYPGSSNSNNRRIQQFTGVFTWRTFKTENRGSMQWSTQFSNFRRDPWSVGSGPIYADMFMMLTQIRYNLP